MSVASFSTQHSVQVDSKMYTLSGRPNLAMRHRTAHRPPATWNEEQSLPLAPTPSSSSGVKLVSSDDSVIINIDPRTGDVDLKVNQQTVLDVMDSDSDLLKGIQSRLALQEQSVNALLNNALTPSVALPKEQENEDEEQPLTEQDVTDIVMDLLQERDEKREPQLTEQDVVNMVLKYTTPKQEILNLIHEKGLSKEQVIKHIKEHEKTPEFVTTVTDVVQKHFDEAVVLPPISETNIAMDVVMDTLKKENSGVSDKDIVQALSLLLSRVEFLKSLPASSQGMYNGDILVFHSDTKSMCPIDIQDVTSHVSSETLSKMEEQQRTIDNLTAQVESLSEQLSHIRSTMVTKPPSQRIATSKSAPIGKVEAYSGNQVVSLLGASQ